MSRFYTEGAAWLADWQSQERARWANQTGDDAGNAAGRAAYQYTGDASLWGKPIPITWGTRRITGQLLQIGIQSQKTTVEERPTFIDYGNSPVYTGANLIGNNITWTPTTRFYSTFAYCFGQPGNQAAKQILRKLWFNGQLVYDIGQGYLSNEIRFRFYQGDEEQIPDAELNRERYTHPVAYRGLMYIVFYDYSIAAATGFGNPLVEAEFSERDTNAQPTYEFDSFGASTVPGVGFGGPSVGYDAKKNVLYVAGTDGNIYKYRGSDRVLLDVYPIIGLDPLGVGEINSDVLTFLRVSNIPYLVAKDSASNTAAIYLINADTGEVVDQVGTNGSGLTPSLTAIVGPVRGTAFVNAEAAGDVGYVEISSVFNVIYSFKVTVDSIVCTSFRTYASDVRWGLTLRQNGVVTTYDLVGNKLYKNGVLFRTGEHNMALVFSCPLDQTIIIFERTDGTAAPFNLYKLRADGTVVWNIDEVSQPSMGVPAFSNVILMQSNTAGQRISWHNSSNIFTLNFLSGAVDIEPIVGSFPTTTDMIYDAYSHTFIRATGSSGTVEQRPILQQTTDDILLSTFLRNLAERQGYETANIQITGINDTIVGAVIAEVTDIENVLTDLKVAYNFEILKRGPVIRFTRRNYGSGFDVDVTLNESDRAILSEDENEFITVNSEIAPPGQTPGTIRLKYIDPEYNYTANEFIHKRNADNVDVSSERQLNLPIIMSGSQAAALAARVLLNAAMNGVTHELRLPQKYLAYEPGDVFLLEFDDYSDTVRAVEIAYNADWSMSIKSEAILTDIGPTYLLEPPILPPEPPELLSGEGAPIIFDTTLIKPTDQLDIGVLEMYVAAIGAGRLPVVGATTVNKSVDGQAYGPIGSSTDELTYGSAIDLLPAGPVMTIEYDAVLRFRLLQGEGSSFQTADKYDVLAGTANRLLVGREGRWEQIGFIQASFDTDTREVTLTGLIRGLRGTEICAALHQRGDLVVLIENGPILQTYEQSGSINETVVFVIADNVGRLNFTDALAVPVSGSTRKPWAVANVHVENSAGDLDFSWDRRTRLYGPLNNGNPTVPLDEEAELYDVVIYRAGVIVRTVENLTSSAYTYTAAEQSADGWSGSITSIRLDIYQISALVGRGFVKAGTYDVE